MTDTPPTPPTAAEFEAALADFLDARGITGSDRDMPKAVAREMFASHPATTFNLLKSDAASRPVVASQAPPALAPAPTPAPTPSNRGLPFSFIQHARATQAEGQANDA